MGEVLNKVDGVMNEDDQVVVSITLYAQNTGTGTANQVRTRTVVTCCSNCGKMCFEYQQTVTINCFIEEEPFVRDSVILLLVHPQLETSLINVGRPGPYDGQDAVIISLELSHRV